MSFEWINCIESKSSLAMFAIWIAVKALLWSMTAYYKVFGIIVSIY